MKIMKNNVLFLSLALAALTVAGGFAQDPQSDTGKASSAEIKPADKKPQMNLKDYTALVNAKLDIPDIDAAEEAVNLMENSVKFSKLSPADKCGMLYLKARVMMLKGNVDQAVSLLSRYLNDESMKKELVTKIATLYLSCQRTDDAANFYLSNGRKTDYLKTLLPRYPDKAKKAAIEFLADSNEDMKVRVSAMKGCFFDGTEEARTMRAKYPDVMAKIGSGDFMNVIRTAASNGDFKLQREMTEYWKAAKGSYNYETLRLELQLCAADGTPAEIKELIANAEKCQKLKDAERLNIIFAANTILLDDKEGEFTKFFNGYSFPANISGKEKNNTLIEAGIYAMNARKYVIAEESCKVRDSLFKPEPKKNYVIGFSEKPISGINDFLRNAANAQVQKLDRKYGGNMDFLVTDVSTGDRAAGIGSAKKGESMKSTDMMIVGDKFGVHFLFRIYDDKAAEIEAGTIGADSFEMYFSPGVNQPYFCFLPNVVDGSCGIWNSTYANAQWKRINDENSKDFRTERLFTNDGYYMYLFVNWKTFFDKLPDAGDIWNFENIHWSRFGGYSWNGIKTIHGRSTWGNLQFNITQNQMLEIKRNIIFEAKRNYLAEKRITGKNHGVIETWKVDDVLGDPKFYEEQVKPMVDKLDSYLEKVTHNMSAETIENVYREAVPGWMNIRYNISELRKSYLEDGFTR